jgi:hypothetical protein
MKPKPYHPISLHPDALAADALAPLIAYAAQSRHGVSDITARMNRLGGTQFVRQQVQQWVKSDPKKRVEPRLGVGILLGAVAEQLESDEVLCWTKRDGWKKV